MRHPRQHRLFKHHSRFRFRSHPFRCHSSLR